jgi:cytochrome c-type biogenesis protein CcmH/NrfG
MFLKTCGALGVICFFIVPQTFAQGRPGGGSGATSTSRTPPTSSTANIPQAQTVIVRGKVALEGGIAISEPIAIERVCNGAVRREGYTDFKGNFEFDLGQGTVSRDATESGRDVFQNSGNRGPTQGQDSDYGLNMPSGNRNTDVSHPELMGCELRASLPGFKTSSVLIRPDGSSWSLNVGVIVLTRMEGVSVSTVSMTTMNAPAGAKQAYEKSEKAVSNGKFPEAEKELKKALAEYPDFAAAWAMLGEVHRHNSDFPSAKADYLRAISLDAKFVNPYYGMAIISVHEKNWPDVLKYADEVTKMNPVAYPLTVMYSGAANYYLGNLTAAEENLRSFEKMDTGHQHPDSSLLLSNILLAKHDYNGAAKALEEFLKAAPNVANAEDIKKQIKDLNDMSQAKQQ